MGELQFALRVNGKFVAFLKFFGYNLTKTLEIFMNNLTYPCPICKTSMQWADNPFRPFCSDRCKLIDLGAWASDGYVVAGTPEQTDSETWTADNVTDDQF